MKKRLMYALLLFSGLTQAEDTLDNYLFGAIIETANETSMYSRIDIPEDVYIHTSSTHLDDVRIFNNKKQPVPFALANQYEQKESIQTFPVIIYALDQQPKKPQNSSQDSLDVDQYHVNINSKDIQINIDKKKGKNIFTANYLLQIPDNIKLESGAIRQLTLDFDDNENPNWQAKAKLLYSYDLNNWQIASSNIPLMSLTDQNNHQSLKVHTIDIPAQSNDQIRYWLITLTSDQYIIPTIKQIEFTSKIRIPQQVQYPLKFDLIASDHEEAIYQLPSPQPVNEITIELQSSRTILPLSIFYKATDSDKDKSWHKLNDYIIRRNGDQDEPQKIILHDANITMKQLKIKAINASFTTAPNIIAYRNRINLIFNSGDNGPFTLAWGSTQATRVALPQHVLIPETQSIADLPEAHIGKIFKLAGKTDIESQNSKSTMLNWVIWLCLIAGAAFLVILGFKLFTEIKKSPQ